MQLNEPSPSQNESSTDSIGPPQPASGPPTSPPNLDDADGEPSVAERRRDTKAHDDFLEFLHGVRVFAADSNQKTQELLDRVSVLELKYRRRRQGGTT